MEKFIKVLVFMRSISISIHELQWRLYSAAFAARVAPSKKQEAERWMKNI